LRNIFIILFLFFFANLFSQIELVESEHKVYDFLKRMEVKGVIDYNPAESPISRNVIANYLQTIFNNQSKLNYIEKDILKDFLIEFEFDLNRTSNNSSFLLGNDKLNQSKKYKLDNNKYFTGYLDSNVSMFVNLNAGLYQRNTSGDSLRNNKFLAGDIGFEIRGTLFNKLGYNLKYSNGRVLVGDKDNKQFVNKYDSYFRTATTLKEDGKFFDHITGYIRYETPEKWLSLTLGKTNLKQGFGYLDKLFFSGIFPYPMLNLNIKYKSLNYSFSYGNIEGDSAGIRIPNKMISTHRLDVKFAKWLRVGFYESVVTSSSAFNFDHLNPFSFLTSADLNTGAKSTTVNNALLGFDTEIKLVNNLSLQGSFLIDDFNLSSLGKDSYLANDNKFGYQVGIFWTDAFTIPSLSYILEYTRLDPFVYAHRHNKSNYVQWGYSLGAMLPPNSDEIAMNLSYYFYKRLKADLTFQFQRSGVGNVIDANGNKIINFGGEINDGDLDFFVQKNVFLQGNRVNRSIVTINLYFEPIRQFYLNFKYILKHQNLIYLNQKINDNFFFLDLGIKI